MILHCGDAYHAGMCMVSARRVSIIEKSMTLGYCFPAMAIRESQYTCQFTLVDITEDLCFRTVCGGTPLGQFSVFETCPSGVSAPVDSFSYGLV